MKKHLIILILIFSSFAGWSQLNTDTYFYTGRSRIYFGNYTGAIEYFNIVIKLKPYLPEPYFLRGVSKHYLEDFRGAKRDYDKALEIKPFYPLAYMYRAMTNYELQNYENSISDYSRALELDPENADMYNNRGIAWAAIDSFQLAFDDYTKSIELKPKNANAYLNRSSVRQRLQDIEGSIADCDSSILINPKFAGAFLNRGLAKFALDDYAGALTDYDQSLRLDPANALAYSNRGIVKHKLEDFAGAIMDYDKALQLNNNFASAYMNRGMAKEALKRPDFIDDYRMAARLDPRFANNPHLVRVDPRAYHQSQHQRQSQINNTSRKAGSTSAVKANPQGQKNSNSEDNAIAQADTTQQKAPRKKIHRVLFDPDSPDNEEEVSKGRIQKRYTDVKLQPLFFINSVNSKNEDSKRFRYYIFQLEKLNEDNAYNPFMTITNTHKISSYQQLEDYENFVRYFNEKINNNPQISNNFLNRGIFKSLTGFFNAALLDLNRAIDRDNHNLLAFYERANTRAQMVDKILSLPDFKEKKQISLNAEGTVQAETTKQEVKIHDYDEVINDYGTVLKMNPQFYFAAFNRGNVYCKLGEYQKAFDDYSAAIKTEPDFAEAYYNRGLVRIYLNDIEGGAMDLSKAGELGLGEAYNVIIRYCY
ncbi:tetratricopeptide repeat protein [Puteibacter caeruleilacunae]|nr:tetratricopeptide repeat protein [Puteibacter caeruleilacunae]